MMYVNSQDKANERQGLDYLIFWLNQMPFVGNNGIGFHYTRLPDVPRAVNHDADIWWNHFHVGVLEYKNRNYPLSFFQKNGFMVANDKLNHLKNENERGFKAALMFETNDQAICLATMDGLLVNRDKLSPTPEGHTTTTNHGQGARAAKPHTTIPFNLTRRIK